MDDRGRLMLLAPIAGLAVALAFGVGLIAMAAFQAGEEPAAAAVAQTESGRTLDVELGDLFIEPDVLSADPGPVTLKVHNGGATEHNLAIEGVGSVPMLAGGESATLDADLEAGTYEVICEVPGHADGGMRATLTVGEGGGGGGGGMTPEEMVAHDAEVTGSFPAKTEGRGGEILEPAVRGGVKVFELTAEAIEWETEPGVLKEAWAYNGTVPGPTIRAELGDRVRIVLHNELPEPTTLHFHGMTVPNDMDGVAVINQESAVMPGESFTYEFTVRNAGTNMYHSHFDAQKQVPLGLLGGFIVPDPDDPPSDIDYSMVLNDGPLGFTLNGKGFPATEPIVASRGDTVRVRYMNEGLQIHPMHLHGMPQEVIAIDGHLLDQPYTADTVLVAPGQRVDVLVKATEPGPWAFHCHVLNHAESEEGMFGMVTALIVE